MKCSELKPNDEVVFKIDPTFTGVKYYESGTVFSVNAARNTVCVSYLEGYKDRKDDISFSDMVAKYDKNGMYMKFGNIKDPSVLLKPE